MRSPARALAAALLAVCWAAAAAASPVTDWNALARRLIVDTSTVPPRASYALALLHGAVFDTVNGISPRYAYYRVPRTAAAVGAGIDSAVAAAARTVLLARFPSRAATINSTYDAKLLLAGESAEQSAAGVAWGTYVATTLLGLRANDGSNAAPDYTPGTAPGDWRPRTGQNALLPGWGNVTPFGVPAIPGGQDEDGSDDDPEEEDEDSPPYAVLRPPNAITGARFAAELTEVATLGRFDSAARTQDQTFIAKFWAQNAGTTTPPGIWNTIAATVLEQQAAAGKKWSLANEARLFLLLTISQADAAISCWWTKYNFNSWRPIAAAQESSTVVGAHPSLPPSDPTWRPLLATPPFPSYTSGHSTFSSASAQMLAQWFGTDDVSFTASSEWGTQFPGDPVPDRSYSSFSSAAAEAGQSRIYGGIHFQEDNVQGSRVGRRIARYSFRKLARPIRVACPTFVIGATNSQPDSAVGIPSWTDTRCDAPLNRGGARIVLQATGERPKQSCNSRSGFSYYDNDAGEWVRFSGQMNFYATGYNIQRRNCQQTPKSATDALTGRLLRLRITCSNGDDDGFAYFYWGTAANAGDIEGVPQVQCQDGLLVWP
ncbi:phosphatidic acid phosphatase type 2/haloperoxidase [Hyaloraphidium curvatum]|nr:phosphatidic acid phosphatase type 2/haloperoxidase [Hyaloraphidium curvatum]